MKARLVALLALAWPLAATAANATRPRTPADFGDVPCMTIVNQGDVLHLDYSVPMDDVELTEDELPDSRTHQFFAFAKQRFDFALPIWVNQSDYDRAEANGDIVQFANADILATSTQWPAATWVAITPDDPRLPITMAQAAMGVDWDTSAAAPGTWLVATYTWEPEQNLWTWRFGAVRIVDPADPDAAGPSVFLRKIDSALAMVGDPFPIAGCIEAPAGSTITASWGAIVGVTEPEWIPFVEDMPVDNGELQLPFTPPPEADGPTKIKVEITDPSGKSYVAYTPAPLGVVGGGEDAGDGSDDGDAETCACRPDRRPAPMGASALLCLAAVVRRRAAIAIAIGDR